MKKYLRIIIPLSVLTVLIFFFFAIGFRSPSGNSIKNDGKIDNFEQIFSQNPAIKNLPSDAKIKLVLYNSTFEQTYTISKNGVIEGNPTGPDMIIKLPIKYLNNLTDKNFCNVIKTASQNGDVGFASSEDIMSLFFKYHSMIKYGNCV